MVAAGWEQERVQPYALRVQNLLARWMYCSSGLLLLLGIAFTAVVQHDTSSDEPAIEEVIGDLLLALVLIDVVSGVGLAAAVLALEWRKASSGAASELDLSGVFVAANEPIDAPLRRRIADGSIRLLRGEWLAGERATASFMRHPSTGSLVLPRRQELPDEAFVPYVAAVAMLDRRNRSILVLSYVRCS